MTEQEQAYHSALSQCAELLDNMPDGHPITDTPRFLAAKLNAQSVQVSAAEVRAQALEEAADMLEAMNDSSGDAAAYDNREQNIYELEREHAIADCVKKVRSLAQSSTADKASEVRAAEWISVEDRLPEYGQTVIALYWPYNKRTNPQAVTSAEYIDGQFLLNDGERMHYPSHWMPLPAAPSTADSGNTDEKGGAA